MDFFSDSCVCSLSLSLCFCFSFVLHVYVLHCTVNVLLLLCFTSVPFLYFFYLVLVSFNFELLTSHVFLSLKTFQFCLFYFLFSTLNVVTCSAFSHGKTAFKTFFFLTSLMFLLKNYFLLFTWYLKLYTLNSGKFECFFFFFKNEWFVFEDRTPSRTHIFSQSCQGRSLDRTFVLFTRTCGWLERS